jgi:hypothetical protein
MRACWLWLVILTSTLVAGCGPQVSREELGEVEFEVPQVPGATRPYELPDFSQPYDEKNSLK